MLAFALASIVRRTGFPPHPPALSPPHPSPLIKNTLFFGRRTGFSPRIPLALKRRSLAHSRLDFGVGATQAPVRAESIFTTIREARVKTRATNERAWFFAVGEKSEGGASERIFHAGENPCVLTRASRIVSRASGDGAPEQAGPADIFSRLAPSPTRVSLERQRGLTDPSRSVHGRKPRITARNRIVLIIGEFRGAAALALRLHKKGAKGGWS